MPILFVICNIIKFTFHTNTLQIGGLNAIENDSSLFWAFCVLLFAIVAVHTYVVWISNDPGMVRTRETDFDQAMRESLCAGGVTPAVDMYCRTTLVKKPIRSKYCTGSGYVISRFDHWCVWLNKSVGYNNHRAFYLLLFVHILGNSCFEALAVSTLVREVNDAGFGNGWDVAEILFARRLFYLVAFSIFLMVVTVGLVALFLEQTINITRNQTTNERLNAVRYSWMTDKAGKPCNKFDRGWAVNVLEFFWVPGFSVNYFDVFVVPDEGDDCHRANSKLSMLDSPVRNKLHGNLEDATRESDASEISRPSSSRPSKGRDSTLSV